VAEFDAYKHAAIALTGDARATLELLARELAGWSVSSSYRAMTESRADEWRREVTELTSARPSGRPSQAEAIGAVNRAARPRDVVVCAAGSLPGDLHRLWRARDPDGYHMEYGYSCMGYEVAGAVGAQMAAPDRQVYSLVGDGSWLMMSSEVATAVQEGLGLIFVLIDNHGFGSIAALSESLGSQGFGTRFRHRDNSGELAGPPLRLDFVSNAASLGAAVVSARSGVELEAALGEARDSGGVTVIYVEIDPAARFGGSGAWWDVPVAEVTELPSTSEARKIYEREQARQTVYLNSAPSGDA
jgi:3D-(3,5/4)-trihydroxycyclohexane-1,2-dione acylhydrolase (decyclizing)